MKKLIILLTFLTLATSLNAKEYFYEGDKKIYLYKDRSKASSPYKKYYLNSKNQSILIQKDIIIKFKAFATVTAIIEEYDLDIKKRYNKTRYILSVKNIDDIFHISNEINNKTYVEYAYPKYINKTLNKTYKKGSSAGTGGTSLGSGKSISEAFNKR
ncbi:MAG: hypothetical protein U9Q33_03005 [Campylobacterota bacterium]|nr:hypothetical protein [Campylobacterota bacterium]